MQMLEGCKLPEGTEKVHIEMAKFQLKGEYDPKLKPKKKKVNVLAFCLYASTVWQRMVNCLVQFGFNFLFSE